MDVLTTINLIVIIMSERSLIYTSGGVMVPTRKERSEEITRVRREQIINAAFEVFSEKGFAAGTTAEIARTAGVAEGTIYNYFTSKRELFIAIIRHFIITPSLLELIDQLPGGNIAETFNNILQNRFNLIASERITRLPVLMTEIIRDPELRTLWSRDFLQPFLSKMEGVYETLSASGKIRCIEPAILVRSIGGMILGFLILKMMEGDASPVNRIPPERVVNAMFTLISDGLNNDESIENSEKEGING
jgi:AcrR family transcriptional regulator